jgi:hypothetical protein
MLVRTLASNVSEMLDTTIAKIAGGDLAILCLTTGFIKGKPIKSLDKAGLTTLLNNYKQKYNLIEDFSFTYNDINDITMDYSQYHSNYLET